MSVEVDSEIGVRAQSHARFRHLDALRAVAALSVLLVHFGGHLGRQSDAPWLAVQFRQVFLNYFDLGLFGVALFFFISGFVIPFSLFGRKSSLFAFGIGRVFRLYPPYWVSLVAVLIVGSCFEGERFSLAQMVAGVSMVPQLFSEAPVSGVYWTLFVEMIFYLMCAGLHALGWLGRVRVTAAIILTLQASVLVPVVINGLFGTHWPVKFLPFHLSFLFSGTLVRLCLVDKTDADRIWFATTFGLQLLAVPVVAGVVFSVPAGLGLFSSVSVVSAFWLAALVFVLAVARERPTNEWLVRIGAASYSQYLLHWPVYVLLVAIITPSGPWSSLVLLILAVAASLVVAEVAYRWIELPSIRLGKSVVARVIALRPKEVVGR
ncbi:acyltransferase [Viridibacterium curvum]|uniref:acyltransferase family protein n=1 Tax=Viridibacterium curvum TaxID=1101404 RepID=UPI0031E6F0EF